MVATVVLRGSLLLEVPLTYADSRMDDLAPCACYAPLGKDIAGLVSDVNQT
jgi:hypothetical protein